MRRSPSAGAPGPNDADQFEEPIRGGTADVPGFGGAASAEAIASDPARDPVAGDSAEAERAEEARAASTWLADARQAEGEQAINVSDHA